MFKDAKHGYFLGLDLSYTCTGIVVVDTDKKVVVAEGIKTKPEDWSNKFHRIDYLISTIDTILSIDKAPISLACIEDYHCGKNLETSIGLVELGFTVRKNLYHKGIPFFTAVPSQIKKYVTGNGSMGNKSIMLKEVYKKWGFDVNDDNVADAFAMAQTARAVHFYKTKKDFTCTKKELEVIKTILKGREFFNYVDNKRNTV